VSFIFSFEYKQSKHKSKLFLNKKTKKIPPKHINKHSRNFFLYILIYSLDLSFSLSLHLPFLSSSYNFFFKKKKLRAHLFSYFVFLFISTPSFLASLDVYCKPHQVSTNIKVYVACKRTLF
jgi:hypothetical protein